MNEIIFIDEDYARACLQLDHLGNRRLVVEVHDPDIPGREDFVTQRVQALCAAGGWCLVDELAVEFAGQVAETVWVYEQHVELEQARL